MKKFAITIFFVLFILSTVNAAGTITSFTINSSSTYTNDTNLILTTSVTGSTGHQIRFSCNEILWSTYETFATPKYFDVNTTLYGCNVNEGLKTVYVDVNFIDNSQAQSSNTITIDTSSPAVTSFSPTGSQTGNGAIGVPIIILMTDTNLSSISISLDRDSTSVYDNNTTACTITGESATCDFNDLEVDRGGIYEYTFVVTDRAGNTTTDTNGFTLTDSTPPAKTNTPQGSDVNTTVSLTWIANTENDLNSYAIYRSTQTGFDCNSQTFIAYSDTNSYTNSGLDENTTYYYKLKAIDWTGNSSEFCSDQNSFTTDFNYAVAPTITRTDVSYDTNVWCYDDSPTFSITGISNAEYSWIITTSTTTLPADCNYGTDCNTSSTPSFTNVANGTNYFKVKACKPTGCSPTGTFILKLDDASPSAPGSIAATLVGYDINLTWTASTDTGGSSLYKYYIYRSTSSSFYASTTNQIGYTTNNNNLFYFDQSPVKGTTYYYKIQARDTAENYSSSSSVTPVSVTIPLGGAETEITIKAKKSNGDYVNYYSGATDLTIEITFSKEVDDMNLFITKGDNNIEIIENMKDSVTTYSTAVVTSSSYDDINIFVKAFSETGWITEQKILYLDTENPTVTFSNLKAEQTIFGIYNIQINATDNYDVNDVKIYVDNNFIGYANNPNDTNWTFNFDTSDYNNKITIKAIVTDGVEKTATANINVSIVIDTTPLVLTMEQVVKLIQTGINAKSELEEKLNNCPSCLSDANLLRKEEADKLFEEAEGLLETNLEQAKIKTEQGLAIYASLLEEINKNLEIAQAINPLLIIVPIIIIIAIILIFFGMKNMRNRGKGSTNTSFAKPNTKKDKANWDKDVPL